MDQSRRKRILIELVPGAIISAPISYVLAQGNNFLQALFIFYFGIWWIILAVTYEVFFFKRKLGKQIAANSNPNPS